MCSIRTVCWESMLLEWISVSKGIKLNSNQCLYLFSVYCLAANMNITRRDIGLKLDTIFYKLYPMNKIPLFLWDSNRVFLQQLERWVSCPRFLNQYFNLYQILNWDHYTVSSSYWSLYALAYVFSRVNEALTGFSYTRKASDLCCLVQHAQILLTPWHLDGLTGFWGHFKQIIMGKKKHYSPLHWLSV